MSDEEILSAICDEILKSDWLPGVVAKAAARLNVAPSTIPRRFKDGEDGLRKAVIDWVLDADGHPTNDWPQRLADEAIRIMEDQDTVSDALDKATERLLDENKSPRRKVGELDNRGSHFYIAKYWAEALAAQSDDADLKAHFAPIAEALAANEGRILDELNAAQGQAVDLGGYYHADPAKVTAAMRPSATLNGIIG